MLVSFSILLSDSKSFEMTPLSPACVSLLAFVTALPCYGALEIVVFD